LSVLVLSGLPSGLSGTGVGYLERLAHPGLESLQVRRLKCDLLLCYKIIHCKVVIHDLDFLVASDCSVTRGHNYKLKTSLKCQCIQVFEGLCERTN